MNIIENSTPQMCRRPCKDEIFRNLDEIPDITERNSSTRKVKKIALDIMHSMSADLYMELDVLSEGFIPR